MILWATHTKIDTFSQWLHYILISQFACTNISNSKKICNYVKVYWGNCVFKLQIFCIFLFFEQRQQKKPCLVVIWKTSFIVQNLLISSHNHSNLIVSSFIASNLFHNLCYYSWLSKQLLMGPAEKPSVKARYIAVVYNQVHVHVYINESHLMCLLTLFDWLFLACTKYQRTISQEIRANQISRSGN